jgi:hypothetical protein
MPARALIPLPGIGTPSLIKAAYEAALIPTRPPACASPAPAAPISQNFQLLHPRRPKGSRNLVQGFDTCG